MSQKSSQLGKIVLTLVRVDQFFVQCGPLAKKSCPPLLHILILTTRIGKQVKSSIGSGLQFLIILFSCYRYDQNSGFSETRKLGQDSSQESVNSFVQQIDKHRSSGLR